MRAFVTGVTGFAGTHLAEHLLACGDQVWGASRSGRWPADLPDALTSSVRLLTWDIAHDPPPQLTAELCQYQPEAIYHLAAISVPSQCGLKRPTPQADAANVGGTARVLELIGRMPGRPRLLLASSCYVYAPVDRHAYRVTEDAPVAPARPYGQTKWDAERLVQQAVAERNCEAIIARAFQHTGPRQAAGMIVPDWARQFASGQDPVRVLSLDTFLDLSDVRDVVRGYRLLLLDGQPGEVYNIGSGECRRSGDVFDALRQMSNPHCGVVEMSPGRRQHPIADLTRIRQRTGWNPQIELGQTLSETLQYWMTRTASP